MFFRWFVILNLCALVKKTVFVLMIDETLAQCWINVGKASLLSKRRYISFLTFQTTGLRSAFLPRLNNPNQRKFGVWWLNRHISLVINNR